MSDFFKDKKVGVTGSHGMIGRELVELLKNAGAQVRMADKQIGRDLSRYANCLEFCEGLDMVFNLVGVTGSPRKTKERPVDFMGPMLQCDTNMILAAQEKKVKRFLYTSSITVLNPQVDFFPAIAKSTGEAFCSAMKVQYPEGTQYCIVRPSNCYGRYARFHNPDMMVITSLIRKAVQDKEIEVWGQGIETRDFLNARDCARAMMLVMEKMPEKPVGLATGEYYSISEVAHMISNLTGKKVVFKPKEASGNLVRPMDISLLKSLGFRAEISLKEGIKEALAYAKESPFLNEEKSK